MLQKLIQKAVPLHSSLARIFRESCLLLVINLYTGDGKMIMPTSDGYLGDFNGQTGIICQLKN